MAYVGLGWRSISAAADTTGNNKGNWTGQLTPQILNTNVPHFEIYKLIVKNASSSATFDVYVDNGQWDTVPYAVNNSWDPTQTLLLNPGNTVYFYFTTASTDGHKPTITAWLRYDPAIVQVYGITTLWAGRR